MSRDYLHLDRVPALVHPGYPLCGACDIEVEHEGSQWLCPSCGTCWPSTVLEDDGTCGVLFADWSGETPTGVRVATLHAWQVAHLDCRADQERRLARLGIQDGGEQA